MRGARCVRRRLRERALEARLYNVSVASSPPRRSFAPVPLASRRRASGGVRERIAPWRQNANKQPHSHVVDDGRAETGETLGGVGHGDVRVHLLLRDGTSERRGGMAEVSVAPEAARARSCACKRQRIIDVAARPRRRLRWDGEARPVRRRVSRSRPERAVWGGWRTAASSSSLRLREICTRMRRGTCGVDGTGGVRCCRSCRCGKPPGWKTLGVLGGDAGTGNARVAARTHVADALRPDVLVELDVHAHVRGLHDLVGELLHLWERGRGEGRAW